MIEQKLNFDMSRCGIFPEIKAIDFVDFKKMKKFNGLYAIWQGDTCIYVGQGAGKGGVKERIMHHFNKAHGIFESSTGKKNSTKDCDAWKHYRNESWWLPDSWVVEFFVCDSAVHRTYLEGAMMLIFNPLCNEEVFKETFK